MTPNAVNASVSHPLLLPWSIACTIGIDKLLTLSLCQDKPEVLQAQFLQVTGQPASVLNRLDKQGLLVVARPDRLEQLALLRPDAVHPYLKSTMRAGALRQMQRVLVVAPDADATALHHLLELWRSTHTG